MQTVRPATFVPTLVSKRRRGLLAAAGASCLGAATLLGAGGCTLSPDADHDGPDAPRAEALRTTPRIAWVLSSGGPRGFAHVGVLEALESLGLMPDLIVGASVGSMVGALFASGRSAVDIKSLALDLNLLDFARFAFGTPERYSGAPMAELVRRHGVESQLERMKIPMACVATRLRDRLATPFTAGDVGLAVQASTAIERQFAPPRIRGESYVDPDWDAPLPVRIARALGARKVLAIDASAHTDKAPEGAERFREGDRRKKALVDADAVHADLVIKPDFGYWVSLSRDFRERAIAAGYRDTMAQSQALLQLHGAATKPA